MSQPYYPYPYNQNPALRQNNQVRRTRRRGGCFVWLAFYALLIGAGILAYLYIQNNPSSFAFLGDFMNSSAFLVVSVIGIVLLIAVIALARRSRGTVFGKLLGGLASVMLWTAIAVFFLYTILLNPHVGMTRTSFTTTYISIFDGDRVTVQNPTDGVTQILCVGSDQQCDTTQMSGYPSQLIPGGLIIQPGQSVNLEFDHAGSYYITSKNTPNMNLKVVVTGPNKKGGDY